MEKAPRDERLLEFYRDHVNRVLLPFWMDRALDLGNGGVYTCFDNEGGELVSTDKYTWSQGRFAWVLSRLGSLCAENVLEGNGEEYLHHARGTVDFLREHAILENGNCAFLLSEAGEKKESIPGEGFDTSFYADCFVVLGFSEYGRVAGDEEVLDMALGLYDRIEDRLASGNVRSEPYPVPTGYRTHSVPMIMLNTSQELARALRSRGHPRAEELASNSLAYAAEITGDFLQEDGGIAEMISEDGSTDTLLARHANPGHALESAWFVLSTAIQEGVEEYVADALSMIRGAFELGWDGEHGGLLRFVDWKGGGPRGRMTGRPYERLILDTWSTKLWWPHAEALYATLLASELVEDEYLVRLYERVHDYTFGVFPNPDAEVGEWIQIRNREGDPLEKIVALPVKDPYHILRSALLVIELLHDRQEDG